MKKTIAILTIILINNYLFSQTDTINNSNGVSFGLLQNIINISDSVNKSEIQIINDGYIKCFLTEGIEPTDSVNAYFFAYELYIKGEKCPGYSFANNRFRSHSTIKYSFEFPPKTKPILLNGTIKFFKNGNKFICEETYENGLPIKIISYQYKIFDKTPYPLEILDYTKKYKDELGSFYYEEREINGKARKYWCLNNGGRIEITEK